MYSLPLFDAYCSGFDMHASVTAIEQMAGALGPHSSDRCDAKAAPGSSAAHTVLISPPALDQPLSEQGCSIAVNQAVPHLRTAQLGSTRPLISIPGAAFTAAPLGGMGSAGMTSLYGKLRTAAVSGEPASTGKDASGQTGAGPISQGVCPGPFSNAGKSDESHSITAAGSSAVNFSSHSPAGGAATGKPLPLQYGMFSNRSYASSYSGSRSSSLTSRSTASSLHAADQGHCRSIGAAVAPSFKEAADTAAASATGQQLLATLGLSGAAQADGVGDEMASLSLLLAAHGQAAAPGTVPFTAEPPAPDAGPSAMPPLAAHGISNHASAVDQLQRLLTQQPALGGSSRLAKDTLHSISPELQQHHLLMQQLAALQQSQPTATPSTEYISPLDALALLDAAHIADSHSTSNPDSSFSLQALLQVAAANHCQVGPATVHPVRASGLDHSMHVCQGAASIQLPGFAVNTASSAAYCSATHPLSGPTSSPSEYLAQLLSQLGFGTSLASSSTTAHPSPNPSSQPTFMGSTGMAGLGVAGGQASSVPAALAALQNKLVLGSLESGIGSFTTDTSAPGLGSGMPTPSKQAAGQLGPGSNPLYKTELCRTWMETGGCRYGARCQFAHGKHELRPIVRHPKYKTQPCRTFALQGSCPYGDRCNFIHDQQLQPSPGLLSPNLATDGANSGGSGGSSSDGASAGGSCAGHALEPSPGQM